MSSADRPNYAPAVKAALSDPTRVLDALGLLGEGKARQRQAAGWLVRCFVHADSTPSCSVQSRDGVLLWNCWGCGESGDVLDMVAAVRGLRIDADFRQVLAEGAKIGGLWAIVDELEGRQTSSERPRFAPTMPQESFSAPERPRAYPEGIAAFWRACRPVSEDAAAAIYLAGRAIDPLRVESRDVARVLPATGALPAWARYHGKSWRETGHRIVVPTWDAAGELRGVRAWRIVDGDSPKRLPPAGCRASELVMADEFGLAMLRGHRVPERVVISEGESDFCVWGARVNDPDTALLGIVSGSWSQSFAERIPIGCHVIVRSDHDEAGDRYFAEIASSLRRRAFVFRSKPEAARAASMAEEKGAL